MGTSERAGAGFGVLGTVADVDMSPTVGAAVGPADALAADPGMAMGSAVGCHIGVEFGVGLFVGLAVDAIGVDDMAGGPLVGGASVVSAGLSVNNNLGAAVGTDVDDSKGGKVSAAVGVLAGASASIAVVKEVGAPGGAFDDGHHLLRVGRPPCVGA